MYYEQGPWAFMAPPPRRRRQYAPPQGQTIDDVIEGHKKWAEYLEDLKKKEKEATKKPPKQSEVLMSFVGGLSMFIVCGLPLGLLYLLLMNHLLNAFK